MRFMPGLSAFVLLIFIAAWSVLGGALRIFAAIQLRKKIDGDWFLRFPVFFPSCSVLRLSHCLMRDWFQLHGLSGS